MGGFITVLTQVIGDIDSKVHGKSLLQFLFPGMAETIRQGT